MVHGSPHVEVCRRLRPWSAGETEQEFSLPRRVTLLVLEDRRVYVCRADLCDARG